MGRRKNKESFKDEDREEKKKESMFHISTETKKSLHAVFFITLAIIITLSFFSSAGAFGKLVSELGFSWFGWGFYSIPIILIAMAGSLLLALHSSRSRGTFIAGGMLLLSLLGVMQLLHAGAGGGLGGIIAGIQGWFGFWASLIILLSALLSSIIVMFDIPLFMRKPRDENGEKDVVVAPPSEIVQTPVTIPQDVQKPKEVIEEKREEDIPSEDEIALKKSLLKRIVPMKSEYMLPSLDMLETESTKPIAGDIKVQANTIKRTLEHFGVPVEMGEVNIGSAVTRYAVKPAEGVKLSKIVNLHNDLALALAA
ncbi:MAG: DNA translocase FtsK, partial [Patescibacteria group bacterium]